MEPLEPWFDRRSDMRPQPGAHALVVGVSNYPYLRGGTAESSASDDLGFAQLSSAAISAYRFGQWLVERAEHLPAPLASCRLLLAPSEVELSSEPDLLDLTSPCTLDHFLRSVSDWRIDASSHRDNMTFLYLAGHCIEQSNTVFLLEDFGSGIGPILRNSIDVRSIFNGMMPSRRRGDIARTQLYFIDSSRHRSTGLKEFELANVTPVFDSDLVAVDDRSAVTFYAAAPQSRAYATPGEPTLFNQALLQCLNGIAGQPASAQNETRWVVTINSLVRAFTDQLEKLNREAGVTQTVRVLVGGIVQEAVIHYLDADPAVDVIIELDPPEAASFATIQILSAELEQVFRSQAPSKSTTHTRLPAGLYMLRVEIDPSQEQFKSQRTIAPVLPPNFRWKAEVGK